MTLASASLGHLLDAVTWLGAHWPANGRFVMLRMPCGLTAAQATSLVDAAAGASLAGTLCLAGAVHRMQDRRALGVLCQGGVMLVLDDVGRATRFGDLTALPLAGIRFETDLVEESIGHPTLGALVDGALHMARDLGLTTFACRSSSSPDVDPAPYAALVDYVSVADSADQRPTT